MGKVYYYLRVKDRNDREKVLDLSQFQKENDLRAFLSLNLFTAQFSDDEELKRFICNNFFPESDNFDVDTIDIVGEYTVNYKRYYYHITDNILYENAKSFLSPRYVRDYLSSLVEDIYRQRRISDLELLYFIIKGYTSELERYYDRFSDDKDKAKSKNRYDYLVPAQNFVAALYGMVRVGHPFDNFLQLQVSDFIDYQLYYRNKDGKSLNQRGFVVFVQCILKALYNVNTLDKNATSERDYTETYGDPDAIAFLTPEDYKEPKPGDTEEISEAREDAYYNFQSQQASIRGISPDEYEIEEKRRNLYHR